MLEFNKKCGNIQNCALSLKNKKKKYGENYWKTPKSGAERLAALAFSRKTT